MKRKIENIRNKIVKIVMYIAPSCGIEDFRVRLSKRNYWKQSMAHKMVLRAEIPIVLCK